MLLRMKKQDLDLGYVTVKIAFTVCLYIHELWPNL